MKKLNLFKLIVLVLCVFSLQATAQQRFFSDAGENTTRPTNGTKVIFPGQYRASSLNKDALRSFLWSLPSENKITDRNLAPVLELPMPDGSFAKFHVWESSIQAPALQAKFSEIKTFAGQGIDDPYSSIRFDYNPYFGFHAQILSPVKGNTYIDPFARGDVNNYMSYATKDYQRNVAFACQVSEQVAEANRSNQLQAGTCRGTSLYTYRLALACTGEYATAVGATDAASLHAAIVTTVNRVDGVYESELSIRLILVANNNTIEYLNAASDPFTGNNSAGTLINESQTVITNAIGSANFDIGHTFSTGGGGIAGLGVVCNDNRKASGITGSSSPVGDAYDIDYVAHEIGHQFGANHTFNSVTSSCGGGNRNAATAYEPGSGTTIMAYAGICSADNIQPNSDPFFHSVSFDEISNYIESGGSSCHGTIATGNTLPVITAMNNNGANIPLNTPFTLTATATDANNNPLTYNWEEWDLGSATQWNGGNATASSPLFKSRVPKTSGSRTFPDMAIILAGYPASPSATMGGMKGETLPTSARTMKFRLTVRDNRAGGGGVVTGGEGCQTGFTTTYSVNTIANTGPFVVTTPNGGESFNGGTNQTVTWNVAGTNSSPINASLVKISLSTDGGLTYPTVLAASTPNDGSELVAFPNIGTTKARIKIEAVGNIFFDISDANFTIIQVNINRDLLLASINKPIGVECSGNFTASATVKNNGLETITGFTLTYRIDGGALQTTTVTGVSIGREVFQTVNLTPAVSSLAPGEHSIQVYLANTAAASGTGDQLTKNDTLVKRFSITGNVNAPLTEGFEAPAFPPANWGLTNADNAITWSRTAVGSNSANAAYMRNFAYSGIGKIDELYSPVVTYGTVDSVLLSFDVAASNYVTTSPTDTLEVLVTKDCGNSFTSVWKKWGAQLQTTADQSLPIGSEFIPSASQWRNERIDLSAYVANSPLQLVFRNTKNLANNIYVDNVNLSTKILPARLKSQGYLILPNPFSSTFIVWHLQTPTTLRYITIYNAAGQLMWTQQYNGNAAKQISIDFSGKASGMYIVNLGYSDKSNNVQEKIIKQ